MNKHIKEKKKIKMRDKSLSKQQLVFFKQFPHLSAICSFLLIDRLPVKKVYKRVSGKLDKDEFQTSLHMIITILYEEISFDRFKEGSQFKYYWNLYKSLGVIFKNNEGIIKFKLV